MAVYLDGYMTRWMYTLKLNKAVFCRATEGFAQGHSKYLGSWCLIHMYSFVLRKV